MTIFIQNQQSQNFYPMSLPKIKSATQLNEPHSQKNLKFKKLKLSTDATGSQADIRARFKSLKTQRLNSLSRYSSVQEQREYKAEKIHLNLLQKKLLTGTYDEAKETGNDLNSLKQKTDQYKVQTIQKKQDTEKLREKVGEIKREIQQFEKEKAKKEERVNKVERKLRKQRTKTQHMIEQFNVFDHMILTRKDINLFIEGKINEDKVYLQKVKGLHSKVENQLRETREKQKNLIASIDRINEGLGIEHKNREQVMYDKQSEIDRRKQQENQREERSKEYKKMLDQIERDEIQRQFYGSFMGVLAQKFFALYSQTTMQSLLQRYQLMENMYNKISSYRKFSSEEPSRMSQRFNELDTETKEYEQRIKRLEIQESKLKQKNKDLNLKYQSALITSKNKIASQIIDTKEEQDLILAAQKQKLMHEKKVECLKEEYVQITNLDQGIRRWVERYAQSFDIGYKKNSSAIGMGKVFDGICKIVRNDGKLISEKKKKQEQEQT